MRELKFKVRYKLILFGRWVKRVFISEPTPIETRDKLIDILLEHTTPGGEVELGLRCIDEDDEGATWLDIYANWLLDKLLDHKECYGDGGLAVEGGK